jgi:type II secretory pathway predicted ATPase ExeA
MYLKHFGLTAKPFAMNPDPTFLYASEQHSAAFTMLEYAIESQAGFCLLTGEIGSGKTTLIRHLLRRLADQVTVGLVSNTHQAFKSIHPWALSALGICPDGDSEIAQYEALTDFVIREYARGRRTLLIFDEAQNLPIPTLEELRLLSNVNSESDVALQILLVGQPELRAKMARPELVQFAQRIAVDFHLQSLSLEEARAYVGHRLKIAGGADDIFDPAAVQLVHRMSAGIPRLINQLCDLAMVYAFAERHRRVGLAHVVQVIKDRDAGRASSLSAPGSTLASTPLADKPPVAEKPPAADQPHVFGRL